MKKMNAQKMKPQLLYVVHQNACQLLAAYKLSKIFLHHIRVGKQYFVEGG